MEGRTKVIPHIFFNGITLFKKFTQITCKSFTKLRLICYKVCSIVITYFRPSPQTLCDGVVKLLAEASELIITLRISSTLSSAQPIPRSASLVGRTDGSLRELNRELGGRMREQIPPHCCSSLPCAQTAVLSGVVMKVEVLIHLPVGRTHPIPGRH